MQVSSGVRNHGSRRAGFASAATTLVLGLTLSACSATTPQTTSAVESPTVATATTGGTDDTVDAVAAGATATGPIPTVTADPLTPTRPTPSAPTTTTPAPTPTTTPTTTGATAPTATDPGSVAGSCERTLPAYPVLQPGAEGPAVRALQCFLNDADYGPVAVDGVYGAQTRAAVAKVEAGFEAPAPRPGRIDAGVWVLLISRTLGDATLEVGSKGADVVTLQRALRAAGGSVTVDGSFGAQTRKVVQRFQRANRVGDDGVVGEDTLFLLKMGATIG